MYSALTGFYSYFQGRAGLEGTLDSYLRGSNSSQFFEQLNAIFSGNPVTGASAELTINPKVQQAAWDALGDMKGAVVAIEPRTGRILAFVSKPGFDANLMALHSGSQSQANYSMLLTDRNRPLINRAIAGDLYAPGSVFKLVVASAALESGKYLPGTLIDNPATYTLPGTKTVIHNSGEGKCGGAKKVTLQQALKLSCNIPFAQVGIALGQDVIRAQAEKFGFGDTVKIPMSVTPSVYPTNMDASQTGLSAFGQFDVRVSPLQIAMISATIANGGLAMQPTLIDSITTANLQVLSAPTPTQYGRAISATTAERVKSMMVDAVGSGVSSNGAIKGISVAGKTGTAQNGPKQPYTLWFTGFAPADDPKVAVAVVIEDGGGMGQKGFGNLLAAPVARKVMQAVLNQ
jgi:peptidoglycan glycosyltransferase